MTVGMGGNKIPKGYKQYQIGQYTPQQQDIHEGQTEYFGPDSYLAKLAGGDQSTFDEMEAPAMRQFQGLQGNIASRFSGMGMGARRGSGFQNTMNQATSDFAQDLASKRSEMRMNAIKELMGFSNNFLNQQPYETGLVKKQQQTPWWQQMIGAASPIAGDLAGGGGQYTSNFFKSAGNMMTGGV